MGYSHYWYRPEVLDASTFKAWAEDVSILLSHLPEHTASAGGYYADEPLQICGWNGTESPEITATTVSFNGNVPELDHETFIIEQVYHPEEWQSPKNGLYASFCKTARKPYDLLVTAALIRFKHYFPETEVSSDGSPKDWIEGLKLCATVFGPEAAVLPFQD